MKITSISDIHGHLPSDLPEGDILIIAGDICPITNHDVPYQAKWLNEFFNPWLDKLPYDNDKIICIAGNHDFVFEDFPDSINLNCVYLNKSSVTIDDLKIYGYPNVPILKNWAFYSPPHELREITNNIPFDTNILITHGPAFGTLDIVERRYDNLGCENLQNRIEDLPYLQLHVCGHIHSGHGIVEKRGVIYVNASYLNEQYQPDYDIISVDI
jgi:Icc-related predicted phosphoesterase